ncbi:MAG TPA: hypothetical protein DIC46_02435 [Porphyromonadaceae bacterium]|jgi:ABC-type lipoprotein release transport system permease subunit|nr:hypothetical protein [Porphyromonadaceae bacterium]
MKEEYISYISKNIGRKKKQSFFAVLCIFISSSIILGNFALNNGIQYKLKRGVNEAISGQWTIYKSENTKLNILEAQLKEQSKFIWTENDDKQILQISPDLIINKRVRFGSLISLKDETSWVNIHALEQDHLNRLKGLIEIDKGKMPDDVSGILISKTTADELHCSVGDSLLLVADNTNDYMSDAIAVISGIFEENGLASFMGYHAFIPYEMGKDIVQLYDDECLEIILNSRSNSAFSAITLQSIEPYVKKRPIPLDMASWDKTIPLFHSIAKVWQSSGYIIQLLFISFSLVILINVISLIVYSRKKEFGTLLSMGFSWRKIAAMVSSEYLLLCCLGVSLSLCITAAIILFIPEKGLYISSKDLQAALMTDYLTPIIYPKNFFYALALFAITTLLAVWINVSRIKKQRPVKLINN